MKAATSLLCAMGLFFCTAAVGQNLITNTPMTFSPDKDRLATLKKLKIEATTITSVERDASQTFTTPEGQVLTDVPHYTAVKLVLNPAKGSNIHVEVRLPDAQKWNSRFVGLGNGGAAGQIHSANLIWPLQGGYATATTDMGTAPDANSGIGNPEVWKDFGFRATHLMTVAAKQIITAYYGKGPDFSYFNGGSTGGQQGLQEAQRYPEEYDGIFAGVPAHCRTPLHAYFLWNDQILHQCPFTKSQEESVIAAGNEYMAPREVPAAKGKFVSDPRCTPSDMEAVIALAMRKDSTLTPKHAEALRKLFDGPKHAVTGDRIFGGIPFGSTFDGARGNLYLFHWVSRQREEPPRHQFRRGYRHLHHRPWPVSERRNPDLSRFAARGGKLIMTSGSADEVVPYHATFDYYERVIESAGGLEKTQSFFKFYLIPGMAHSGGPGLTPQTDMLAAVRNWREKGIAPNEIRGRRVVDGKMELEMPIYPYPTKTRWDEATSSYKPENGARGGVERVAARFRPEAAQ